MAVRWDDRPHVCAKCARPCWLNVCLRCARELRRREMSARAGVTVAVAPVRGEGVTAHLPPRSRHPLDFAVADVGPPTDPSATALTCSAGGVAPSAASCPPVEQSFGVSPFGSPLAAASQRRHPVANERRL